MGWERGGGGEPFSALCVFLVAFGSSCTGIAERERHPSFERSQREEALSRVMVANHNVDHGSICNGERAGTVLGERSRPTE